MIISHGKFPIRPDQLERAKVIMAEMARETLNERGCISYDFYLSISEPNTMLLFQEWESIEAVQDHFNTEHMDNFLQALPELLEGEVIAHRYAVQSMSDTHMSDSFSEEYEEEYVTLH